MSDSACVFRHLLGKGSGRTSAASIERRKDKIRGWSSIGIRSFQFM